MQQARRSSTRSAEAVRQPEVAAATTPFGERGNQARLDRMGQQRSAISQQLGLLEHASSSFGDLDKDDAERLAKLNEQLAGARGQLAEGDLAELQAQLSGLDSGFGDLVSSTGTIIDMAPTQPGEAQPGTFDNIDSYYVNGMTNSLTQSMTHAQELANVRGTDVGLVYNDSEGTRKDLQESMAQKAAALIPGWEHRTKEGETLANAVEGSMDAGRQVDIVTHSQGAMFAREAIERLDGSDEANQRLDENVHINQMGSPLEDDALPDHFDNTMFIDENSDPVARDIGRRKGKSEGRSFWNRIGLGMDNHFEGDVDQLQFESGAVGFEAHRAETYLDNQQVRDHLASNPFERVNKGE